MSEENPGVWWMDTAHVWCDTCDEYIHTNEYFKTHKQHDERKPYLPSVEGDVENPKVRARQAIKQLKLAAFDDRVNAVDAGFLFKRAAQIHGWVEDGELKQ